MREPEHVVVRTSEPDVYCQHCGASADIDVGWPVRVVIVAWEAFMAKHSKCGPPR